MAEPGIGGVVKVAAHARRGREIPHQDKERNDDQLVIVGNDKGFVGEHGDRRPPAIHDAETNNADQRHGQGNWHAQRQQYKQCR